MDDCGLIVHAEPIGIQGLNQPSRVSSFAPFMSVFETQALGNALD
jgi:hypothetical protein